MIPLPLAATVDSPFGLWHWLAFGAAVTVLLLVDLLIFHREDHIPSLRESALWTVFWCSLAAAFNVFVWWWQGPVKGQMFLAGYLLEWMLSMDNVFVFAVIFGYFGIPLMFQYRVLFWGILGAIILRLTFILIGAELISRFHWVIPVFGAFLVITAVKLATSHGSEVNPERNLLLRLAKRFVRVSVGDHRVHGKKFFVRESGFFSVTPMFLVLLVVESTDVIFAIDSIPAIFGITKDPFIVFTSNIFAILGLRALYFLLAGAIAMFRYLHYGLAIVLGLVGLGMIADYVAEVAYHHEGHLVPTWAKLIVIVVVLGITIVLSLLIKPKGPIVEEQSEIVKQRKGA
ncbi:MAG: TerC family protein [Planctomycetota bacterium]